MQTKSRISVVVPCFNEQEALPLTHKRLMDVLGSRPEIDLEIVYVDDGSVDSTSTILDGLVESDRRIVVVPLTRNFGHQAAITAGLKHATGNAVAVIDADLQDPPEVILAMIEKWRSGYEVVYGIRTDRREAWLKRVAYSSFYRLLRVFADVNIPLDSGDFALIDRKALDVLNALPERGRFVRGLRAWIGFRQAGVAYARPARAAGVTKYSLFRLIKLAFDGIFSLSIRPLSMVFWLGVASSAIAMLGFLIYLVWSIIGIEVFGHKPENVPGFTTIVLLLFLLNGVQLISIGVIGEYVGRIYEEAKDRPTFLSRPPKRADIDQIDN
jgi:dolichol-phosphate mannosyltransferase